MSRGRLIHRLRVWAAQPDPEPPELFAFASAALFVLAVAVARQAVVWVLARYDRRRAARRVPRAVARGGDPGFRRRRGDLT